MEKDVFVGLRRLGIFCFSERVHASKNNEKVNVALRRLSEKAIEAEGIWQGNRPTSDGKSFLLL